MPVERPEVVPRASVHWTALGIAAGVLALLVLVVVRVSTVGASDEARQEAALTGYWQVTGQVLQARDSAIQVPGETLHRLWWIHKTCAGESCGLQLTREIAGSSSQIVGGTLTAPMVWSDGHWLVRFTEANVSCETSSGVSACTQESTWTVTLTDSETINALEHASTGGPGCVTGITTLTWRAAKLGTPQPLSA